MVHALKEIHRVLKPGCILVDLRPLADRWPVEISTKGGFLETGRVIDLPTGLGDDMAADESAQEAARLGWFMRQQEFSFPFYTYWDDPGEMISYISERWTDFLILEDVVRTATWNAWKVAGSRSRVRIKMTMLLASWLKQ
jgi:hypothetical protein